ncbi:conserved hypothetical protein [Histoplasma capsulatum var. duboisii H88]|uniref:Protein kinase domain-containing protein n=2 Tax=Ajellomyces capsulatus (strain H88) TaxID=544711 RepID=F0UBG8_AJEC8|nr:conserved hypothetical protein [Histoplasma capsulatum var. duboisii H88]
MSPRNGRRTMQHALDRPGGNYRHLLYVFFLLRPLRFIPVIQSQALPTSVLSQSDGGLNSPRRIIGVYRSIGGCDGVVPCISISDTTIELAPMEKGHLRTYLEHNRPPKSLQLSWFREIRRGLAIAISSLLSDLSIWFCDFTMSSVLPLDTNIKAADDNGYSAQTDIGLLGAVIYEVVTGERSDRCRSRSLKIGQIFSQPSRVTCSPGMEIIGATRFPRFWDLTPLTVYLPIKIDDAYTPSPPYQSIINTSMTKNSMLPYLSIVQHLRTIGKLIRGWPVFVIKIAMFINFDHTAIETKVKDLDISCMNISTTTLREWAQAKTFAGHRSYSARI